MDYQQLYNDLSQQLEELRQQITACRTKHNDIVYKIQDNYVSKAGDLNDAQILSLKQDILAYSDSYRELVWKQLEGDEDAEYQLNEHCKRYPELKQLYEIDKQWGLYLQEQQEKQNNLNNLSYTSNEPHIDCVQQMSNLQAKVEQQVAEVKPTAPTDGHIYPVAMVESWTKELKSYSAQLNAYVKSFNALNLDNVDRTWLQKQVQKFVMWIKDRVAKLQAKITKALNGMMKPVNEVLSLVKPILSPPSIKTIIGWANKIISYFMAPYQKVIQFIADFATYTPPLVKETATLAATAASVPPRLLAKVASLQDEAALIAAESLNNVKDVDFGSVNTGDVNTSVNVKDYQQAVDSYKPTEDEPDNATT
jgi:predicted transport protein